MPDTLYEQDFFRWTEQQADTLRAAGGSGTNLPLDRENLADEIESLGRRDRVELSSRIGTIIEHLLKLEHPPATTPRQTWRATILRSRRAIERLLEASPSLRQHVATLIADECASAPKLVAEELRAFGEVDATLLSNLSVAAHYSDEQILGDWFPARR
jgi:hypothetical protein